MRNEQPGCCRLCTDGAARGNPGHAGAGAVLYGEDGAELVAIAEYLGICTNNVAEYRALLAGLRAAHKQGCRHLAVATDSELMARQLIGQYRVRQASLQSLHQEALRLLAGFQSWQVRHVPRKDNARADQLANAGIDTHLRQAGATTVDATTAGVTTTAADKEQEQPTRQSLLACLSAYN